MATSTEALIQYEGDATMFTNEQLTTADNLAFDSLGNRWSSSPGFTPVVRPNGLETGGAIIPGAANDQVAVAAGTVFIGGLQVGFSADPALVITRPAASMVNKTVITIDSLGVITAITGTDSATFSDTFGAAGGPPFVPVDEVMIGQVHLTSDVAALIIAAEIKTRASFTERFDSPAWTIDFLNAGIDFTAALALIHTGSVPKQVFASYAEPIFFQQDRTFDWVPADESFSASTRVFHRGSTATQSTTLNSASFSILTSNNITDAILAEQGKTIWFKYFADQNETPFQLTLGTFSFTRTNPTEDETQTDVTIIPRFKTADFAS